MHKDFVKIPSFFQCRKIAKRIRLRLKNHFSQLETTKKPILLHQELLKKKQKLRKTFQKTLWWRSPVSGLRSPLCLQNVSFLEKSRTNIGYRVLGHWEKNILRQKNILKNLTMPKNFENSICCKISKNWRWTLWRQYESFKKRLTMTKRA